MSHTWELTRLREALAGQYEVEREIGRGGMGMVFLARDITLDRRVAIKTLPAHLAFDDVVRERFLREARTAASLSHPNIVPIHRAEQAQEIVYFVMGLVDGPSVAQRMRQGPFSPAETIAILADVADALGYAHGRGVIHRDVKAENILLDPHQGRAMVTDFGIARLAEAAPMTATGTVLGTVHYMSPEQVAGQTIDGRSDLYSLGVLAFYMLSGRFPFEHAAPSAVLVAHVMSHAPALSTVAPDVPASLAAVVDRLLARDPHRRYESAAQAGLALSGALAGIGTQVSAAQPRLSSAAAAAVWERAALLQEYTGREAPPPVPMRSEADASAGTTGYRLDQVREAAEQAGIDARYVERALAERAGRPETTLRVRPGAMMSEPVNRWLGARTKLEYEAVLEGDLTEEELEEIVDEMRRSLGVFGSVSTVGRTLTFTSQQSSWSESSPRRLQVSVTSRGGRTTLRAYEDLRQMSHGIVWGVTGGAGGGLGGAAFGAVMAASKGALIAVAPLAFVGVAAAAYASSRVILRTVIARREREIVTSMERLVQRAQELLDARRRLAGPAA
ncbi:MAG: serine/threonine protein kinase [Gemmatimonadaceae bacterium]|nr:serine/threonine protein kinase [Gemmatimonadaceae bacterium]